MNRNLLIILPTIGVLILGIYILIPKELTRDECYRLDSNLRMLACLEELDRREGITEVPEPTIYPYVTESGVLVQNARASAGNNPLMFVTVKNVSGYALKSVFLKIEYYDKNQTSCQGDPLDTENLSFTQTLEDGDTKLITIHPTSVIFRTPSNFCITSLGGEKLL